MKKRTARKIAKSLRQMDRREQAAHILNLMDELIIEIRGIHGYVRLLNQVLEEVFPDHIRFGSYTKAIVRRHEFYLHTLYVMQRKYRQIYDGYAHDCGSPEIKHLMTLEPFMMSIHEILDMYPVEQVVEDFLDG